ncbi:MAG: HNH endonuclease [Rhodovibrio sp.]|nr:HNH endonuclease [Rhodovibrio sp.]
MTHQDTGVNPNTTSDGSCWYCGIAIYKRDSNGGHDQYTVDHLVPKSKGGTGKLDNLVAACRRCNAAKNNRTVEEYRETVKRKRLKDVLGMPKDAQWQVIDWVRLFFKDHPTVKEGEEYKVVFWGERNNG